MALTLPVGIFLLLLVNEWAALGMILSLFNGEGFIGYWMKHGVPFGGAIGIAIACSTFDITMWFRFFFWIRDVYGHAKTIYEKLERQISSNPLDEEIHWLYRIKCWGLRLYLSCVPQPYEYDRPGAPHLARPKQYAWMLFYGFMPTGILPGVGYAVAFHLDPKVAFSLMAGANAIKMVAFGYLALRVPWKIIAAIVVIVVPLVRLQIERQHRRHVTAKNILKT